MFIFPKVGLSFGSLEDDNKKIRFNEKSTVIQSTRRKTIKLPRMPLAHEDDAELSEIMSLGPMEYDVDMCQLCPLMGMIMASIVDDAAESCCIMGKTFGLPDPQIDMTQKDLLERNALLRSHSTIFNPETLEEYSKTANEYMIRKMHADIVFLQNILSKGVKCLLVSNNYHSWLSYVDNYDLQLDQDEKLLEMVANKKERLGRLKLQVLTDKLDAQKQNDELSLAIGKARDDVEDFIIEAEITDDYVNNWEKSRRQQNLRVKTDTEKMYEDKIKQSQEDFEKEKRVHSEIVSYMQEYFTDLENSIESWMVNYDKDIETKDDEIVKMGLKIEGLNNDLDNLQEEYDGRIKEMNIWLERKAEKERIEQEYQHLVRMTIRIQSWWRGIMVRRKLGPYRPKKKKGKKGDKKGDKKGQKGAKGGKKK